MSENIVEEIKNFVKLECDKTILGREIYLYHFIPVANYAKKLAEQMNGNIEIIEVASWLHDIGSIVYERNNHHITGAEIAEKKLRELNCPKEKIELIKKCILNHRGSVANNRESIEEQIIAEADSLTFFDNIEGYFLWVIDGDKIKKQKLIKESVRQKAQNKWNQLSSEAKDLVKLKYEAIMLLFGD